MPAMNAAPAGRRRTLDLKPFILYASYTLGTGHLELHARHIAAKAKHVEAGSEVLGGILISSRASSLIIDAQRRFTQSTTQ